MTHHSPHIQGHLALVFPKNIGDMIGNEQRAFLSNKTNPPELVFTNVVAAFALNSLHLSARTEINIWTIA